MKRYLQKVVYCTEENMFHAAAGDGADEARNVEAACGVEPGCIVDADSKGVLYITDNEKCLRMLKERGLPAAAWLHGGNKDQDLSGVFYAVEHPEELDLDFFEKIYRREKGIPWDIVETDRCLVREMVPEDAAAFAQIYKNPDVARYAGDFHNDEAGEAEYIREYQQQYRFFEYGVWSVVLKTTGEVIGRVGFSPAPAECEEDGQGVQSDVTVQGIRQNEAVQGMQRDDLHGEAGLADRKGALSDEQPEASGESRGIIGNKGFEFPQFGYMIGAPWQGQGLAYEVCEAVLKYAREELGFETISLWVEESNAASRNLCRKLGFSEEKIATPRRWCYYEYVCEV